MNTIEQTWTVVIDPGFGEISEVLIPDFTIVVETITRWSLDHISRAPLQAGGDLNTGKIFVTYADKWDAEVLRRHANLLEREAWPND